MKKSLSIFVSFVVLMTCIFLPTLYASAAVTGICGDSLAWSYDIDTRVLVISGTGDMYDYQMGKGYAGTETSDSPWNGQYRKQIKKVVVSDGVTSIGDCAFYHCTSLEEIVLPEGLLSIGDNAISRCDVLKEFNIPTSVTSLGESFVSQCPLISSVVIPDAVTSIPDRAFSSCFALSNVSIPDTVTSIGNYAFSNCSALADIALPTKLTTMGTHVFYASGIKELTIPDDVTTIDVCAFYNCTSLEKLTLGDKITSIGSYAFYGVNNLTIYAPENSYAYNYAVDNNITVVAIETTPEEFEIKSVSYEFVDGKIVFSITTNNGDANRIKVGFGSLPNKSIAVADKYTVNLNGERVWTAKTSAPKESTVYAFDARNSEGKYYKNYFYYEAQIETVEPIIKSINTEIKNGKIYFTVVTAGGEYNRIKVTTADNLSGSIAVGNTYTIDGNGNYIWIIRAPVPKETTKYAFDLRSAETGRYLKDYYYSEYVYEDEKIIKSVSCEELSDKLVFTVITKVGEYSRLRCGLSESVADNIANSNSYTVNSDGDYVWTVKVNNTYEDTIYYFDLRSSVTGKYLKEYFVLTYYYF